MKPRLKNAVWVRNGENLQVVYDVRERFTIVDADGIVELLLELLRDGGRTVGELADALASQGRDVGNVDVANAIESLDMHGLLTDDDRLGQFDHEAQERFYSNLAFFDGFANLARSQEDYQLALRDAHVLVLGTGGLNSNTIPHLCGLGVGRLTLLDHDVVAARNFARQYLYRRNDVGARKVHIAAEWVRTFEPETKVEALDISVQSAGDLTDLVDRLTPDIVMSGIDSPQGIDDWVNEACVTRGVPYVRGGMWVTLGSVWSVNPGVSACRACSVRAHTTDNDSDVDDDMTALRLYATKPRENRGIGPVAGLLGALCAFEALRYLTRFEPPAYAGRRLLVDFSDGCRTALTPEWPRNPACRFCGGLARAMRTG